MERVNLTKLNCKHFYKCHTVHPGNNNKWKRKCQRNEQKKKTIENIVLSLEVAHITIGSMFTELSFERHVDYKMIQNRKGSQNTGLGKL
jgi:hypothetical protein